MDIPDEVVGYCNDLDSYADALVTENRELRQRLRFFIVADQAEARARHRGDRG